MSGFIMGSRMCNYCRRNLPSPDLCGCEGEKKARVKSMEAEIEKARATNELSERLKDACYPFWQKGEDATVELLVEAAETLLALRRAIELALECTPSIKISGSRKGSTQHRIVYDCGDPWEILRAALPSHQGAGE